MRRHLLRRTALAGAVLAAGLSLSPTVHAAPVLWEVVELQPLMEEDVVEVHGINAAGTSVGESGDAFVTWDAEGVPTALPLPEEDCFPWWWPVIGDRGDVVSSMICDDEWVSVHWRPDRSMEVVPAKALPEAVDANGITVGSLQELDHDLRAVAFADGVPAIQLPDAGAEDSWAHDLTDWGYVVGYVRGVPTLPEAVAVGWYGDQVFPLLTTSLSSGAIAVNESGVALVHVWDWDDPSVPTRGYLVEPGGRVTALDPSGATDNVLDLNDYGIAVGTKGSPASEEEAGRFYVGSLSIRLADIVSDEDAAEFGLEYPKSLNNDAWVVGNTSDDRGWLLKPPAP